MSYLREDQSTVDRLVATLRDAGVQVWLDREQIKPGYRWQAAISAAIADGAMFVACFSSNYVKRATTYVNEELTLAIDELRKRPVDRAWFIPVLLDKCQVPDRRISAAESLRDIQWIDLSENWEEGVRRLIACASDLRAPTQASPSLDDPPVGRSNDQPKRGPGKLLLALPLLLGLLMLLLPVESGFAECRAPDHGVERYQREQLWQADSGWRGGGYSLEPYCRDAEDKRKKQYPDRQTTRLDAREDHKSEYNPFKHDYYRYQCWFRDNWDPVYNLRASPSCPRMKVSLWRYILGQLSPAWQ
jgi:hypothetical protein